MERLLCKVRVAIPASMQASQPVGLMWLNEGRRNVFGYLSPYSTRQKDREDEATPSQGLSGTIIQGQSALRTCRVTVSHASCWRDE